MATILLFRFLVPIHRVRTLAEHTAHGEGRLLGCARNGNTLLKYDSSQLSSLLECLVNSERRASFFDQIDLPH